MLVVCTQLNLLVVQFDSLGRRYQDRFPGRDPRSPSCRKGLISSPVFALLHSLFALFLLPRCIPSVKRRSFVWIGDYTSLFNRRQCCSPASKFRHTSRSHEGTRRVRHKPALLASRCSLPHQLLPPHARLCNPHPDAPSPAPLPQPVRLLVQSK
ncbi:hypothetical protein AAT19DRAFT_12029 [Rhodotorula toruloides]|uniref:Uncharacterized protein n=1 Tax=Rhodotorula toruloides TaxID=5286 RepID=A0A2T0AF16_RHOTO|nr:hypothetical protein AAT19DRAFT_12029 [Rhodotorula toruloides]